MGLNSFPDSFSGNNALLGREAGIAVMWLLTCIVYYCHEFVLDMVIRLLSAENSIKLDKWIMVKNYTVIRKRSSPSDNNKETCSLYLLVSDLNYVFFLPFWIISCVYYLSLVYKMSLVWEEKIPSSSTSTLIGFLC